MNSFWKYLQENGTKVLGYAQGTVATLCGIGGIIPDSQMKYWLAASAILTYWRGSGNTQAIAQAVVDKHLEQFATSQPEPKPPFAKQPETPT